MSAEHIAERVAAMDVDRLVITGGEPMIHQSSPEWAHLLDCIRKIGISVDIETNGTLAPLHDSRIRSWVVSPKLSSSGTDPRRALKPLVLARFVDLALRGRAVFKFVCGSPQDVAEVAKFAEGIPTDRVWISPLGTTPEQVAASTAAVADAAINCRYRLGTRLHILAWGNERGH